MVPVQAEDKHVTDSFLHQRNLPFLRHYAITAPSSGISSLFNIRSSFANLGWARGAKECQRSCPGQMNVPEDQRKIKALFLFLLLLILMPTTRSIYGSSSRYLCYISTTSPFQLSGGTLRVRTYDSSTHLRFISRTKSETSLSRASDVTPSIRHIVNEVW